MQLNQKNEPTDTLNAAGTTGRSTAQASCTLADVAKALETDGLGYSAASREAYLRALRRHTRITGCRAETISADPVALDSQAKQIAWVAHGFASEKAFRLHWAKVIGPAKRLAGRNSESAAANKSDAWRQVAAAITELPLDRDVAIAMRARWASLSRMATRFEIATPAEFDAARVLQIAEAMDTKRQRLRENVVALNRLIEMREHHEALSMLPAHPVPVPPQRPRQLIDWDALPHALNAELERVLDCLANGRATGATVMATVTLTDVVQTANTKAFERQKPATIQLTRAAVSWSIAGQLACGRQASDLTSLEDLCTPLAAAQAAEAQFARQQATGTYNPTSAGPYQYTSILCRLATRFYVVDASTGEQWKRLLNALRIDRDVGKIATKHQKLLDELLNSRRMQRAWLTLDQRAWDAAEALRRRPTLTRSERREMVQIAEFAVLMTILIRTLPTRLATLPEITFRGEAPFLRLPRARGDNAFLDLPPKSVKNARRMLVEIPEESLAMIRGYLKHFRPIALEQPRVAAWLRAQNQTDCDYLIPGISAGGRRSRSSVAMLVKRGLRAFGFTGVTTHVVRHFMAQLLLEADPNAIGVAADWLGDTRRTIETHYRISDARSAARHGRKLLYGDSDAR
ncbi:tyrosine-type recombinase/integrase [Salinarimonas ramus]|uniref:Uncharacterized protein n=1 Tax=Salinarimonas ramus TaxID=690164 RepID=A0A917QIN2_9HYPH|nr:site-specific integrase [Salinarimonas ramus]GGK52615.1 hypothetical protein GCM10011322_44400 [Salinarimonas ramus]